MLVCVEEGTGLGARRKQTNNKLSPHVAPGQNRTQATSVRGEGSNHCVISILSKATSRGCNRLGKLIIGFCRIFVNYSMFSSNCERRSWNVLMNCCRTLHLNIGWFLAVTSWFIFERGSHSQSKGQKKKNYCLKFQSPVCSKHGHS